MQKGIESTPILLKLVDAALFTILLVNRPAAIAPEVKVKVQDAHLPKTMVGNPNMTSKWHISMLIGSL